jgi:hypothetical protein
MVTTSRNDSSYIAPDIRIERMNTDKTRKITGSSVEYQIFFDLSGTPAYEWRTIFFREWKASGSPFRTELDGPFLVLYCPLRDMTPAQLAALQSAAMTANVQYHLFARSEMTTLLRREQEWKQERTDVETVASSLHFELSAG